MKICESNGEQMEYNLINSRAGLSCQEMSKKVDSGALCGSKLSLK